MSSIGAMVGIGGSPGAQGLGYQAGTAPIQAPTTAAQATAAYNQAQTGIANQGAFLTALQGQSGIANQSSVFGQLQGVANGTGPNPAAAQLAQATQANTANQAALMAGQRGAGANVGLMARQAAQQGGANQQQAAGQAATMQAQQQIGALGQLGGIAGQQVGQQAAATGALTGAQQSEQGLLLNSIQGQNNAYVQNQGNMNQVNSGMAQAGGKAQSGLIGGLGQAVGLAKGGPVLHLANGGGYDSNVAQDTTSSAVGDPNDKSGLFNPSFGNTGGAPAGPTAPAAPTKPKSFAQSAMSGLAGSQQSSSGQQQDPFTQSGQQLGQGMAGLGKSIKGLFSSSSSPDDSGIPQSGYNPSAADIPSGNMAAPALSAADEASAGMMAHGGKVPAMVSPGERYLSPTQVEKVAKGKDPIKAGEKIPGKAKVKGDSLKNDTVPKTLEEGGIVLPKSIMESKHPHWEAHKFVSAILAKQGLRGKKRA